MIGERIKLLRTENNLSQDNLAKKIKSNQKQISKWERNQIEPNIDALTRLADYFEVSVDYLIGRTDSPLGATEMLHILKMTGSKY